MFRPTATQEMLDQLEAAVRAEGGMALTRKCAPYPVAYQERPPTLEDGKTWRPQPTQQTCTCLNETLLQVPLEDAGPDDQPATICAVCDAGVLFPRFRDMSSGLAPA
jgi:hypothetical protein